MSVLDRDALEGSPLADLHIIAGELGLDGFRRLRKADLVDAILTRQGGVAPSGEQADAGADTVHAGPEDADAGVETETDGEADESENGAPTRRRRRSRGGRGRSRSSGATDESADDSEEPTAAAEARGPSEAKEVREGREPRADREPRGDRESRGAKESRDEDREERTASGTVELLANGSGFLRVAPPEPSEDDVYVSAAQIRRCELVSGDEIAGPVRPPRRSERYPSLIRVETINGRPADEVAEGTRFEELPVAYPQERFKLGSDDPTVKAIEFLTPFGKGSRVVVAGGPRAGKTEALSRLAAALTSQDSLDVSAVLIGVRPEEIAEWEAGPITVAGSATLAASPDAQAAALERAVEHAQRIAARGGDAVVLVDTLDDIPPGAARRALGAARNLREGGSLTVLATARHDIGGETTVITLDPHLASTRSFPALDLVASGTIRPELLVGEAGAEAIATARSEATT